MPKLGTQRIHGAEFMGPKLRHLFFLSLFFTALFGEAPAAQQPTRLALVIGNMGYSADVGRLKNPHNDIRMVGDALKVAGFQVMPPVRDATRSKILSEVRAFAERLQQAGPDAVGFVYYSGHGAAIGGQNYLIPIDVTKPGAANFADGGVPHSDIINRLVETAPQAAHYLVIDACRYNLGGTRGPKGFVSFQQRDGILIAFAASPEKPASDEGSTSGPFAATLAAELRKPAKLDLLLFHHVRVGVDQMTGGEQVPWIEDGLRRFERPMLGLATISPPPVPAATRDAVEVARERAQAEARAKADADAKQKAEETERQKAAALKVDEDRRIAKQKAEADDARRRTEVNRLERIANEEEAKRKRLADEAEFKPRAEELKPSRRAAPAPSAPRQRVPDASGCETKSGVKFCPAGRI